MASSSDTSDDGGDGGEGDARRPDADAAAHSSRGDGEDSGGSAAGADAPLLTLELRGAASASSIASLVRGFAALYGGPLHTTFSHAPAGASEDESEDAVYAVVTYTTTSSSSSSSSSSNNSSNSSNSRSSDATPAAGATTNSQTTKELHGRDAIVRWMREQLERQRTLSPPQRKPPEPSPPTSVDAAPLRIFVSGDRSQVGKSTVCLGLVGALLRHGFAADDVAYIKPVTQCEQPQLVAKFCRARGVSCTDIGPIVFYAGFTREFLQRRTESSEALLAQAGDAVAAVGCGKKVVVVDGVGYPAVGSICGVSNAAVARAVQAPVVLVGKRGVGDAVDSFNLNASFFEREGVKVLGAIFNRLPRDGYYSLANCCESVSAYFEQYQPHKNVFGFIPEMEQTEEGEAVEAAPCDGEGGAAALDTMTPAEAKQAKLVIDTFYEHVDLTQLLEDARRNQAGDAAADGGGASPLTSAAPKRSIDEATSAADDGPQKRSRADIQAAARASGAAGG